MEKSFVLMLSIIFFMQSCNKKENDVAGIYIKSPSNNTIDSLYLYTDSLQSTNVYERHVYKYTQRFYNKKTRQLLFQNNGTWWINGNGRLELDNLYLDIDNNPNQYSYSKEAIKNALISASLPINGNKIIVDLDMDVFYIKVTP